MAWTDPVRYPNPYEQINNEEFLNTNVIDNLVNHQERIVTLEEGGGGGSDVVFAATSNAGNSFPPSGDPTLGNWTTLVEAGATRSGTTITLTDTGIYEIFFSARISNIGSATSTVYINNVANSRQYARFSETFNLYKTVNLHFTGSLPAATAINIKADSSGTAAWSPYDAYDLHSIVIRKIG
jgi:hypothetical protein